MQWEKNFTILPFAVLSHLFKYSLKFSDSLKPFCPLLPVQASIKAQAKRIIECLM